MTSGYALTDIKTLMAVKMSRHRILQVARPFPTYYTAITVLGLFSMQCVFYFILFFQNDFTHFLK